MKNRHSFKKAVITLSTAAVFMGTGIFGMAVTAWADPGDATVNAEGSNVRASAVDGETTDTLSAGKEVTVLDSTTGSDGQEWYQIEYTSSGQTFSGWIRGDLLDVEDTEEETAEEETEQPAEEAEQAGEEEQEGEQEPAEQEAPAAEEETQSAEVNPQEITLVVSDSIPVDIIPDGFQQTTVSYEGKEVPALEMENAEVYLLYMEDASHQTDGRLVVYDLAKSELIPYINFQTDDGFILLLNIPDAELSSVSDRFAKTVCEFETGTMDALQMTQKDPVISESANLTDFYYMYGVNRDGSYGWYVYNAPEGTIEESILSMHYNLNGTSVDDEEESSSFSLDSLSMVVIVGIIVILLLLLILLIIFAVRYRQLAKTMDGNGNRSRGPSGEQTSPESDVQDGSAYGDAYESDVDPYASSSESLHTEQDALPTEGPTPQETEAPTPQETEAPISQESEAPTPQETEAPGSQETEAPTPQESEAPTTQPEEATTKRSDDTLKGTPDPEDDDLEFL